MSATLALKVAAPVFAFAIAGLIWAVAGPLAAGLSLVTFLMGVVTSELDHMRWKPVADAAPDAAADSALLALLEVRGPVAQEPAAAPPPRPRHHYRATRNEMAIGSGGRRRTLHQRTWREPPALVDVEPIGLDDLASVEADIFGPLPTVESAVPAAEPASEAVEPAPAVGPEGTSGGSRTAELRPLRAEPPPPKVTVFRASYAERVGRR